MATRCDDSFTTLSKAATSAPAIPMSIASPRFQAVSSTNAPPRAFLSLVSMEACSTTAPLVAHKSPEPSYARGQTGQQLLIGCYQALEKEVAKGGVEMFTRTEMLDLVVVDGHAKGVVMRNLKTGKITTHAADAVILATGGYGNVFYLSTNAMGCNVMAAWKAHKKGAYMANPCYTQIHPTCIPVSGDYQSKLTLMSESLRNDGRIWVPKSKEDAEAIRKKEKKASDIAEEDRDYYLERKYPSFGNLAPRDIASRSAKEVCDDGLGISPTGLGVFLDFRDAIERLGEDTIRARYGNLFQMYEKITGENPYKQPMQIFPAVHYTMGGLWVDYNLMSNVPGLHVLGEANFSDHGANRLGASAPHAGTFRRLLRHSHHHCQLLGQRETRHRHHRPSRLRRIRKSGQRTPRHSSRGARNPLR